MTLILCCSDVINCPWPFLTMLSIQTFERWADLTSFNQVSSRTSMPILASSYCWNWAVFWYVWSQSPKEESEDWCWNIWRAEPAWCDSGWWSRAGCTTSRRWGLLDRSTFSRYWAYYQHRSKLEFTAIILNLSIQKAHHDEFMASFTRLLTLRMLSFMFLTPVIHLEPCANLCWNILKRKNLTNKLSSSSTYVI